MPEPMPQAAHKFCSSIDTVLSSVLEGGQELMDEVGVYIDLSIYLQYIDIYIHINHRI